MRHVYPLRDERPHVLEGTECPCNPEVDWTGPEALVIHSAFDGRELIEQAELIFKHPDVVLNHGE